MTAANGLKLAISRILVALATQVIVSAQDYCDPNTENVTLKIVDGEDACPSDPITIRCVVKKSPEALFLAWKCSNSSSGNNVLCGPIVNFTCEFGKVFNITGECQCDDGSIIISEAKFLANQTMGPKTLFCGNGIEGHDKAIAVSSRDLGTPILIYENISVDWEPFNVRLMWTTPDSDIKDIMYKLKIENTSYSYNLTTKQAQQDLYIYGGQQYMVTVYAERCDGRLRSSNYSTIVPDQPFPTTREQGGNMEGTENNSWLIAVIISGVVVVMVIVAFLATFYVVYKILKARQNKEVITGTLVIFQGSEHLGEGFNPTEIEYYIHDMESTQRIRNGAICIDCDHVYYSCREKGYDKKWLYTLRKRRKEDGYNVTTVAGFDHIRGIDRDGEGNTYVVDSNNQLVVKFDKYFNPIRRTSSKTQHLREPFGLFVKGDHVYVCDSREKTLIILDKSLNLLYKVQHRNLLAYPTDIAELDDTFFVTCSEAIIAIDINVKEETFTAHKLESMTGANGKKKDFASCKEFRGICSDYQYLYVAESKHRLLCLRYDAVEKTLQLIESIECSPLVIASHGSDIYFSRIESDKSCYIAHLVKGEDDKLTYKNCFKL